MDAALTENLRTAVLLIREVSQSLNADISDHVEAAVGSNSGVLLMATLSLDGPQRPQQLARKCGLSPAGLSSLLLRIEEAGLIERTSGVLPYDRRSVMVVLTRSGRRFISTMTDLIHESFRQFAPQMKEFIVALEQTQTGLDGLARPTTAELKSDVMLLFELAKVGGHLTDAMRVRDPSGSMLDPTSTTTLLAIDEAGQCRPGHLSFRMQVTSGGTTRMLDRLAEAGLVARTYGSIESDRRGTLVKLTRAGRSTAHRALAQVAPFTGDIYAAFLDVCLLIGVVDT